MVNVFDSDVVRSYNIIIDEVLWLEPLFFTSLLTPFFAVEGQVGVFG